MGGVNRVTRELVRSRAGRRCEYCGACEEYYDEEFWIDHIIAEQHGGETVLTNLALACIRCNRHKGPNLSGRDPIGGAIVALFHPRNDDWSDHFEYAGAILFGRTDVGRATIGVLNMNDPFRVAARAALLEEGLLL